MLCNTLGFKKIQRSYLKVQNYNVAEVAEVHISFFLGFELLLQGF